MKNPYKVFLATPYPDTPKPQWLLCIYQAYTIGSAFWLVIQCDMQKQNKSLH